MVLETFWFYDENDYEYEIFSIKGSATREPASFWRENVVAVVILLRVLERVW